MSLLMVTLNFIADLPVSGFDLLLGIPMLIGLFRGFRKGFAIEITSLIALFLGVYGAINFSYYIIDFLNQYLGWDQEDINIIALIFTFIIIVIGISILGKLITKLADLLALGLINRILGGVFGLLKIAFVLSVLIMFFASYNKDDKIIENTSLENSYLYQPLKNAGQKVLPSVFEKIKENSKWDISLDDLLDNEE